MITISQLLQESIGTLSTVSDTPSLDAQNLLATVMGKSRSWVLAHPEANLTSNQVDAYHQNTTAIVGGMPLPYVLEYWEFFGLEFHVTPDTLIPRPETELMVEKAIHWLRQNPGPNWGADVGTGSGCVAVAIANHANNISFIGTDISFQALDVASKNALHHKLEHRIHLLQTDLAPRTSLPMNLICANLPYIPTSTLKELEIFGREPRIALDGGEDGLALINRFLNQAPNLIAPGGLILIEIDPSQGSPVIELASRVFPTATVEVHQDLAGLDRLIAIQLSPDYKPVTR